MKRFTKSQERLFAILHENVKTLGEKWFEKNKNKYSDDYYKAYRYLEDKYFKRHNIFVEAMEMMDAKDKNLCKKWYESMDEIGKEVFIGSCEDDFLVEEIWDAL